MQIKMLREAVEHRPDGTGRRRYAGRTYTVGTAANEVSEPVAKRWLQRKVAKDVTPADPPSNVNADDDSMPMQAGAGDSEEP